MVQVSEGGDVSAILPVSKPATGAVVSGSAAGDVGEPLLAPLAGNIFKVNVAVGEHVQQGDIIIVLEAMKMETEVRAAMSGSVGSVAVKEGDSVAVGDLLITIA